MAKINLKIDGMTCAACSAAIERALSKAEGVQQANVNFPAEKVYIEYQPQQIELERIEQIIEDLGYQVVQDKRDLASNVVNMKISGMTCASCSSAVERALRKSVGVQKAQVNLATETATVEIDRAATDYAQLKQVVENSGYSVVEKQAVDSSAEKYRAARRRMQIIWLVTIPIMLWMIPHMFWDVMWPNHFVYKVGMIVLAASGLFSVGQKTFRSAFKSLVHGSANMDVLIMLGTLAAFSTGILNFFMEIASFAGISAMIMAFHLTGRYIEVKAKGRASQAIRKLLEMGAKTAVIQAGDSEREIAIEDLQIGDIMLVKPGAKIPTDGIVISGKSTVDEAMATGESVPVKKQEGSKVLGATINQNGFIKVKVEKIGKETFLSQIIKLVEEAQGSKVPIQEFADKVTAIFVPIVIVLAALAFSSWLLFPDFLQAVSVWASQYLAWVNPEANTLTQAVFATVAVLVIACPCALGLATPTALMVGSGIGAENGILIRNGAAIQTMKNVQMIVFDKTGTITKGKPEVTDIWAVNGDEKDLLQSAAALETKSDHPIAVAILKFVEAQKWEIPTAENFDSIAGQGLQGELASAQLFLGNRKLLQAQEIDFGDYEAKISQWEAEAKTVILLARADKFLGMIAIADAIKPDSISAISQLHELGFKTAIISGDNRKTAQAMAAQVKIDYVVSEVMPQQKVDEIKQLQNKYGMVAMVGDGINDAPALKQADVGIALGTGTDIAIESADITIVKGQLNSVVEAVKLSQATFGKIKQNLFWAFAYNLIAIPLAFLGMLHPVIAEIAMATSSITVVTNANLLRRVKLKD
jgi:Cu+-exporting ATPase